MASLPPGLSFLYTLLGWLTTLFAARPPAGNGCAADTYISARHEDQPNLRIMQDTEEGEGLRQGATFSEGRSQQGILQLNKAFMSSAEPSVPRVILDSGAYHHVVGDNSLQSLFITITKAGGSAATYYQARDGRLLTIAGTGTISWDNFHLPDVLYVPDLRTAVILVSVPLLVERGYLVMFGGGHSHVEDRKSGKIVGKGRLHGDDALYHLEFLQIPATSPT